MEKQLRPVVVGIVGAGYAAQIHGRSYAKVGQVPVRVKTVCDLDLTLCERFQQTFGCETITTDFDDLLADPEIEVIDIVTPPALHCDMAIRAMHAGKHVICEKPLTGYFGETGQKDVGHTEKRVMLQEVRKTMERLDSVIRETGRKFMYAENLVYAPAVQKSGELIAAKGSKILLMNGFVGLKGSSSPVAGFWSRSGGGQMMRNGVHPLGAMLWLKQQEAQARGESIGIRSVVGDVGCTTACLTEQEHRHIAARPYDVEDFASVTVTFTDGSKCQVVASDTVLGGTYNTIDIYCNDNALRCNLTPPKLLDTYFLDEDGIEDLYLAEMLPSKLGWNQAFVCDGDIRGHVGEMQNFMETVACDRQPICGFELAKQIIEVIYSAYVSAEEGRRIDF